MMEFLDNISDYVIKNGPSKVEEEGCPRWMYVFSTDRSVIPPSLSIYSSSHRVSIHDNLIVVDFYLNDLVRHDDERLVFITSLIHRYKMIPDYHI